MLKTAPQTNKTARITDAMALTIMCEACEELCEDQNGSTMIGTDSQSVTCPSCGTTYAIPPQAFQVVCKAKCKAVK